jgi:RimJ/RimL family protein N-acetyltransferase
MGFAVEMYLDAEAETRVLTLWDALARAGVTCYLPDIGSRPHISLAVFSEVDADYLQADLADFAHRTLRIPITLSTVGLFPLTAGVVYIAPVVTPDLLAIHRSYHKRLAKLGVPAIDYYRPGTWVPHCTAGMHIPPDKIPAAVEICMQSKVFGPACFTDLGLIEDRHETGGKTKLWYGFPLAEKQVVEPATHQTAPAPAELVLETQRLLLRPTHADDVDDVFEYMGDPEVMRYRAGGVQTYEQVAQWVARISRTATTSPFVGRVHQIVLKATGRVIGYCYLDQAWPEGYGEILEGRAEPLVEITYGLARAYWRFGYAAEAARAILAYGFDALGLSEIAAAVHPANVASIYVLERIGMTWRRHMLWRGQERVDFYTITRAEYDRMAQS